jgi:hypothetical protein
MVHAVEDIERGIWLLFLQLYPKTTNFSHWDKFLKIDVTCVIWVMFFKYLQINLIKMCENLFWKKQIERAFMIFPFS